VKAAPVERARGRHADARDDLVRTDDRGERAGAGKAARLGDGERYRARHRAHMRDRVRMRIVEVEPVTDHRVGEGRVRGRQAGPEADDGGLLLAAELRHRLPALDGDAEGAGRETAAEGVEQVKLRGLGDVAGDVVEDEGRREIREAFRSSHLTPSNPRPCPERCLSPRAHRACRP
jgi:hypothetical protein